MTIGYYNQNATRFFSSTADVDMPALHGRFLSTFAEKGKIFDAGCGSGRDTKAFLDRSYRATTFVASAKLARLASEHTGIGIPVRKFMAVQEQFCHDGIWTCARLLHVPRGDMSQTLQFLWAALKPDGTSYLSFKLGTSDRNHEGRHFTGANEEQLCDWFSARPDSRGTEYSLSADQWPGRPPYGRLACRTSQLLKGYSI